MRTIPSSKTVQSEVKVGLHQEGERRGCDKIYLGHVVLSFVGDGYHFGCSNITRKKGSRG